MDILSEIIAAKRERVQAAERAKSKELLYEEALATRRKAKAHALVSALNRAEHINVIAEFKRRSPSKGVIRSGADPALLAHAYEDGGAVAISVLTEEDYFDGSLADLRRARSASSLPILRKDFIFDEYQIYESAAAGADALLLIVATLPDDTLARLRHITENELEMDSLVEVHTRGELDRALAAGAKLIGVNNRDLRTFQVSLETSVEVARETPADVVLISESGLNTRDDLVRLQGHGYKGFLIGESLMRADEPDRALRLLIQNQG